MPFAKAITDRRHQSILSHAAPYLDPDEEVVLWARARNLGRRRDGFLFVTDRRCIVHWTGRQDGHFVAEWPEIDVWGVDPQSKGGPVLRIERGSESIALKLRVTTAAMAANANEVLEFFVQSAPKPRRELRHTDGDVEYRARGDLTVESQPKSLADQGRRLVVTFVGLVLLIGGIAITPLPGPWSFPVIVAGLAVLASEYDWAQDLLTWLKLKYEQTKSKLRSRRSTG